MPTAAKKVFACGSVVPGCQAVMRGETEAEILMLVAEHARANHDVDHMSDALKAKVRAAIRDA